MSRSLVAALARLLEGADQLQDGTCSASAFTPAQRQALEDLGRKTGALRVRPEGRGSVYQVVNVEILRSHLLTLRPQHAADIDPTLPTRAANIAQSRSSKGGAHGHELHYLLVKAISADAVWVEASGDDRRVFELARATKIAGAGVLAIRQDDAWCSEQPLWLVENQALFDRLDWLPFDACGTVAYYAGNLSGRLLDWLACRPRASQVVIFPDYDGVGLLNYAKLLERSRSPCRFWLMQDWQARLQSYGSNAVWQNTQADFRMAFARLKALSVPTEVMELCVELSKQGLALEHEAVWLDTQMKRARRS